MQFNNVRQQELYFVATTAAVTQVVLYTGGLKFNSLESLTVFY